jgi:hypothetical protein
MAQPERAIRLRARGAEPNVIRARAKDRVVWRGTDWKITFTGRTPCQNGKRTFSSTETGLDRICIISVPCSEADKSGCGKYKYTSQAEGGQPIDPEIDVEL